MKRPKLWTVLTCVIILGATLVMAQGQGRKKPKPPSAPSVHRVTQLPLSPMSVEVIMVVVGGHRFLVAVSPDGVAICKID